MRIDYHPAIAAELEEIRDHYEACSPGLGSDFVDEFERQVLTIAAMPTRWMIASGDVGTVPHEAFSLRYPVSNRWRGLDPSDHGKTRKTPPRIRAVQKIAAADFVTKGLSHYHDRFCPGFLSPTPADITHPTAERITLLAEN